MCTKGFRIIRSASSSVAHNFFVTTPIYYVNANPHIGHLYSSVIADAINRWHQLEAGNAGGNFKLSTGTDEHGSKIQQAAQANDSNPLEYCDRISTQYKKLASHFSINYSDFIRTTDNNHQDSVHKFWRTLKDKGHIYSGNYSGWYCVSDETFLTESQLTEKVDANGRKLLTSAESGHPVEWTEEFNYMFPLGAFQEDVRYWITRNENTIRPRKFAKILLDMLDGTGGDSLPPISISRPSSRVHWGIRVPEDESQTVYVWLDALVNYLTAAGYYSSRDGGGGGSSGKGSSGRSFQQTWPADVHVIGKDILKFHGIYWPAFLIAAGLEPPRSLFCHSHWTVDGEKMSKSKGNVVCPFDRSEIYTSDGLRYFLLREGVAHSDGNYSDTKVMRILNSELADTLGNLLSRCTGTALNPDGVFPALDRHSAAFDSVSQTDVAKKLMEMVEALPATCRHHYAAYNFYKVVDHTVAVLHQANLFFETLKPWELRKQQKQTATNPIQCVEKGEELKTVLHLTLETLRVCSVLLQPLIPNLAGNLLDRLSVPPFERNFKDACKFSWGLSQDQAVVDEGSSTSFVERKLSGDKAPLFQRILTPGDRRPAVVAAAAAADIKVDGATNKVKKSKKAPKKLSV